MTKGQAENILIYLQSGKSLTGIEALELFQTMKLATRISELRAEGKTISDEWVNLPNGKRVKRYFIPKPEPVQTLLFQ